MEERLNLYGIDIKGSPDYRGYYPNIQNIPTVEEQKEEIKAMNERIKKIERQRGLELVISGFILGAVCCVVLYILVGGYL